MNKKSFLTLVAALLPLTAHAFEVKHDFYVTVGAFDASKTSFSYKLTPHDYQVKSIVATDGILSTLYPFKAEYYTAGIIINDQLTTTNYSYTSQSRFKNRSKQIFYQDGIPQRQLSSVNNKTKSRKFSLPQTPVDTFDLQTVIAKLTYQYNTLGFCDSTQQVYNGKQYFTVTFSDDGFEELPSSEHGFYHGPAARCRMTISKLLSQDDDNLWEIAANNPIYLWLASDSTSGKPFIAKFQIKDTPLGELNAYTSSITVEN